MIIARDDDAPIHGMKDFIWVHELLKSYGKKHTVALICRNLDKFHDFVAYVKDDIESFDLQFHCLDHIDYSDPRNKHSIEDQFREGVNTFNKVFGFTPTVWYPSWNRASDYSVSVAEKYGLKMSNQKYSLDQFLRNPETIKESGGVINMHHWCKEERILLSQALEKGL